MDAGSLPIQGRKNIQKPALTFLLAAFVLFLFFFRLGERPLRNPDEGRYAEISRAMQASNDWVVPRLYGIEYLRKPILFYWLVAASLRTFGVGEFSARLVPAAFGVLGVAAVFGFARRWGSGTAAAAALILSTNLLYLFTARYLIIDAVFSFFTTAALFLFYEALEKVRDPRRPLYLLGAFAALGCSFLAKGPIGALVAGLSLGAYGAVTGRLGRMFRWRREAWIAAVFAAIALPWFFAILRREPEFLQIFFWRENFGRALSSSFEHQEPWFFYFALTPLVLLPWSSLPPLWKTFWRGLKAERGPHRPLTFCAASIISMLAFFSLARGKLHTYLLPTLPFWAVLFAWAWRNVAPEERFWKAARAAALFLAFVSVVFILAVRFGYEPRYAHRYPEAFPAALKWIGGAALAGCAAALAACLSGRQARRFSRPVLFAAWLLFATLTDGAFLYAMETVNPQYTTRSFARALRREAAPDADIFLYGQPGAFYDFAFYLGRPVRLVGLIGEFEVIPDEEEFHAAYIPPAEFKKRILERAPLYVLMRRSDFDGLDAALRKSLRVLLRDSRKVLATTLAGA